MTGAGSSAKMRKRRAGAGTVSACEPRTYYTCFLSLHPSVGSCRDVQPVVTCDFATGNMKHWSHLRVNGYYIFPYRGTSDLVRIFMFSLRFSWRMGARLQWRSLTCHRPYSNLLPWWRGARPTYKFHLALDGM